MRIVETKLPMMMVRFDHPDDSSAYYHFVIEDDDEYNIPDTDIAKLVWDTYNSSGYYHEMEITCELFIDGVEHTQVIYKGGNPKYAEGM